MGVLCFLLNTIFKNLKKYKMKIYSIYLSEDGLNKNVCTNAKVLFNEIEKQNYSCKTISVVDRQNDNSYKFIELKYNYSNLLKAIKISSKNNYYAQFTIDCEEGKIHIEELNIISK